MGVMPGFEDLRGRKVLITGASLGIGAAVARGFGDCGAHVGVHYNRSEAAAKQVAADIEAAGGKAVLLQADLGDPSTLEAFAAEAENALGGIDILINNAGAIFQRRPFEDADDEFYCSLFDLNVRQVVGVTRRLLPALTASDGGVIINTTSIAVKTGGAQGSMVYAATKAALNTMSVGLSKELGPKGIRVNCVAPGVIETPFHEGTSDASTMERARLQTPLGRLGQAEDCVGAYLFLASNRLAGYITGTVIDVTGGR
jgi:3-oxoacyl-[acyl-carrier protein] reductase